MENQEPEIIERKLTQENFDEVMSCVHAVDGPVEAHINHPNEKSDWCNFIMCNGEPDCEVADCYVGGFIDRWLENQD